jgi:SAM-dependent methyltransferase
VRRKLTKKEALDYWTDMHEQTTDQLAAVLFPDRSPLFNRFFDAVQRFAIGRAVASIDDSLGASRILDIGCGRGRWLQYFSSLGAEPEGIDVAPAAVQACRLAGFTVRLEAAEELSSEDESFDLVSAITVLLHLTPESQAAATREMSRVCRAGGHILILEPTHADSASHVFPRSVQAWIGLFPGFDLVRAEGHYFAPLLRGLWASQALRALPRGWRRWIEDFVVICGWPIEFALMRLLAGRSSRLGLQHLIVLRKRIPHDPVLGDPSSRRDPATLGPSGQ